MTYREELHDFAESNGFDPSDEFKDEEEDEDEFDRDPRPADMTEIDARIDEMRGK